MNIKTVAVYAVSACSLLVGWIRLSEAHGYIHAAIVLVSTCVIAFACMWLLDRDATRWLDENGWRTSSRPAPPTED